MNTQTFIEKANFFGASQRPFLFIIDFELLHPQLFDLETLDGEQIYYHLNDSEQTRIQKKQIPSLESVPVGFDRYKSAFQIVMDHIQAGNSYLTNLTFATKIKTKASLREIFNMASAPYKLFFKDEFIIFSPECFIKTFNGQVFSYPMKGTIDAGIADAVNKIIENKKEEWEHNTITDLIRNDLAMIATHIEVERSRFITKITTNTGALLQVSSEIRGNLANDWQNRVGDMLIKILPAGSISGAPKQKTIKIIQQAEKQKRGYFTGIFGVFDGIDLQSAVNIRYIEKTPAGLQFRSGGGITAKSDVDQEYKEMIQKVYVPVS